DARRRARIEALFALGGRRWNEERALERYELLYEAGLVAEAVTGLTLHKQNFRRGVERTGLVEATGALASATGGRPAELYRSVGADPLAGATLGLTLPAQR
ncbi:MAG: hypothetical protein EON58_04960, partial [Alphaproteobacteria bacterium]